MINKIESDLDKEDYVLKTQTGVFVTTNGSVSSIVSLTQQEFNMITSPSPNTIYIIKP